MNSDLRPEAKSGPDPDGAAASRGFLWLSGSQVLRQAITVVATIALARLLSPGDFGVFSLAFVVVGVAVLVRDFGLGPALIHAHDPDAELVATAFWTTVASGFVSGSVAVLVGTFMSGVLSEPTLPAVVVPLAAGVLLSSVGIVPQAMLERRLRFRTLAMIDLASAAVGTALAVAAAYADWGIFALVVQWVVSSGLAGLAMLAAAALRPAPTFSVAALRGLVRFSGPLVGFQLVNYASRNGDYVVIGAALPAVALGQYSLAYRLMLYPLQLVSSVLGRVTYPVYARTSIEEMRWRYLEVLRTIAFIAFPAVLGLMAVADRLIAVLFGTQWLPAIPVLVLLAPVGLIQTIVTTIGPIYQACGRTDLLFRWGVASTVITLLGFVIGVGSGIVGVAVAYLVVTVVLTVPALWMPFRLIELRFETAFVAIARPLVCALLMAVAVTGVSRLLGSDPGEPFALGVAIVTGIGAYGAASRIVNPLQFRSLGGLRVPA